MYSLIYKVVKIKEIPLGVIEGNVEIKVSGERQGYKNSE